MFDRFVYYDAQDELGKRGDFFCLDAIPRV